MTSPIKHTRREPAPGVFRLVLPLPWPGLEDVNAYLLTDESGPTLVDCGMVLPDEEDQGWGHLVGALQATGHEPADVKRLILTHTHIDHYGLAGRLKEASGCEVWLHRDGDEELDVLRDPASAAAELRETYAAHGLDAEEAAELTSFEDWRRFVHSIVPADRWLKGDEDVAIGGRDWRFVHTPGHARSHVCLYSGEGSLLISGDHLLGSVTPHIDFRRGQGDPLGDFLASLEKVERLYPEIVFPGHGRPFRDGADRARATVRHHERRLGAILQVIRRKACTADEITEEIFGSALLNFHKRLALGEALAHLHYLRVRGEIERIDEPGGTRLYRKLSRRALQEVDE